ncbi:MAG: MipA/OmpV family protein [Paracoccus sp. (in: a-proteobacteria)]|uniref:MipA/OmpV family protein n=1 Tax=Paracoccus sp. TaxID=267 RepID=UPI0026E10CE6|nr:MipA/OmpV family protein [Paracoccus sp. (in: a-proteobacteria)]MDO5613386.1 MipA/OmpV family protein [Paracoccus sp. (in: a-proteobacteria)]
MSRFAVASVCLAALLPLAGIAQAQTVDLDLGLGAKVVPDYQGADSHSVEPWLIWRSNLGGQNRQGFSYGPSFRMVGARDAGDSDHLAGLEEIDRAYELGARFSYGIGQVTGYATLRRGFGGHEGVVGTLGARYRTDVSDRLTVWTGVSVDYANSSYMDTYFGVSADESAASGLSAYDPGAGFKSAAARIEARYAINDTTALLGEVEYGRLIGDAADSPVVLDKNQPSVRIGVTRRFSFGF